MVVEVMGRHTGWIAVVSGIAGGADMILIPEQPVSIEDACKELRRRHERGKDFSIVVVSEGYELEGMSETRRGRPVRPCHACRSAASARRWRRQIEERTGYETRVTVLGHVQRGGSPTPRDRVLATRYGLKAADLVDARKFGRMAALHGDEIVDVSLAEATAELKTVPPELVGGGAGVLRMSRRRRALRRPEHDADSCSACSSARRARSGFATWREYGWRAEPDPDKLADGARGLLHGARARAAPRSCLRTLAVPTDPDSIYVFDPAIVSDRGAIVLRPGKEGRLVEADAIAADFETCGRAGRRAARGTGDRGRRRHDLARRADAARRARLPDERRRHPRAASGAAGASACSRFDLPHLHGSDVVLHLLSLLSPLDDDLVVAYLPLLPVRLVQLLTELEIRIVEVPDDEFETMGANVLALAPRVALALEGNDETRRRLERAGVDVTVYSGDEISRKGDGGPTCLTRPLLRA